VQFGQVASLTEQYSVDVSQTASLQMIVFGSFETTMGSQ